MSATCLRLSKALHFGASSVAANSVLPVTSFTSSRISSSLNPLTVKQLAIQRRHISTSQASHLKEIVQHTEGNTLIVEGKYVESPNAKLLIPNPLKDKKVCPLCALNLNLKHTDVLVLSQFVRPDGRLLPRRVTGLCCSQQYKLTMLVTMSKKAGLMPNLGPANSHKDPTKRRGSKKYNRYFDEATIRDTRLKNISRYKEIAFPMPKIPEIVN